MVINIHKFGNDMSWLVMRLDPKINKAYRKAQERCGKAIPDNVAFCIVKQKRRYTFLFDFNDLARFAEREAAKLYKDSEKLIKEFEITLNPEE